MGIVIEGLVHNEKAELLQVKHYGQNAVDIVYKIQSTGIIASRLIYKTDNLSLNIVNERLPWSFDGDGELFRLVSEAQRIRLAHLFDPLLAVHTSDVEPLPHQITAVYEAMLMRQPLRFLLADDPGAGKTIMAGLLIKELIARGDINRCLIVCPGSLVEQWQDELYRRFNLRFEIMTNDKLESAPTGNWFVENHFVIARLDKLSRDDSVQSKLKNPESAWDLVVCDEAHKMSASYYGQEARYTKRYQLGRLLSGMTRHFLLMTATPHNGKEDDFNLFMSLLDNDRFEGPIREGAHMGDASDIMRRMVKENLFKFDSTPLFPERFAYTVPYKLSDGELKLYQDVTDYVREQFNRVEALQNDKRAGTVGFALTILQRRLASSPEAIYQSLRRRKERLEIRLKEFETTKNDVQVNLSIDADINLLNIEDMDNIDEFSSDEVENAEEDVLDQATAARTIDELKLEITILKKLESTALSVRKSGSDRKWKELAELLTKGFERTHSSNSNIDDDSSKDKIKPFLSTESNHQKMVIFTEHRDTLRYLHDRIVTLLGRPKSIVTIHGGIRREERLKIQESFLHDPDVKILLATDAAGEGINLQRAHLMVNYDLPWNPNRIEQRFGRIHRIGQTEVCHLWNLVAEETREGDVYLTLLHKLNEAKEALGGKVFDVLGKLQFGDKSLKDLLIDAIRYGEKEEVRARLFEVINDAFDEEEIRNLLENRALAQDSMDTTRINRIREDMERAEIRRLQPNYIESFFIEVFKKFNGRIVQRENQRYQINHVPVLIRNQDRLIGSNDPVLQRYERIVFDKSIRHLPGKPMAEFVSPGHPLLNSSIDLVLDSHGHLLRKGCVLVDDTDFSEQPRVLFYLEHSIRDGSLTVSGENRTISKRMLYIEVDADGNALKQDYAPYLDYRPLTVNEPAVQDILDFNECNWINQNIEEKVLDYAISTVVPDHLDEVRSRKFDILDKTEKAVKERLTKEINYWDRRSVYLSDQEKTGKRNARLNSGEARKRADQLQERLNIRMQNIKLERQISSGSPLLVGGVLVMPAGLLAKYSDSEVKKAPVQNTQLSAARARAAVMEVERSLNFDPVDREFDKLGYDIESKVPGTGKLRFIEVKGRNSDADTITVTKNEILTSLNKPDDYILAIVEFFDEESNQVHYVRRPFNREPDFGATSVNYDMSDLLERAEKPS